MKIIKLIVAFAVIIGIIFFLVTSISPQSYNGTELNFEVKGGSVSVTNPTDLSIPAYFASTGTRTFRVSSDIDDVSGSSVREGTGAAATQLFEFELPAGTSEFTIERGTDVMFVATASESMGATVNPMSSQESRMAIGAAIVGILGILFYASRVMDHSWIYMLTGKDAKPKEVAPAPDLEAPAARAFGDNRNR